MDFFSSFGVLDTAISHEKSTVKFSKNDKVRLCIAYFFDTNDIQTYLTFFKNSSDYIMKTILDEVGVMYGSNFFNMLFEVSDTLSFIKVYKFVLIFIKHLIYPRVLERTQVPNIFLFHKNLLLKKNAIVIFDFLKEKYLIKGIYLDSLKLTLLYSSDSNFKKLFTDYFKITLKNKTSSVLEKENANKYLDAINSYNKKN
jgi:hypothetical protein